MLETVERINSCSGWTVYAQLASQDGVAISIDLRELIEAGWSLTASASSAATVPT